MKRAGVIAKAIAAGLMALALSSAVAQGTKPAQPASSAQATSYAQRFASLCASCHGANGRSDMAGTPVLAG